MIGSESTLPPREPPITRQELTYDQIQTQLKTFTQWKKPHLAILQDRKIGVAAQLRVRKPEVEKRYPDSLPMLICAYVQSESGHIKTLERIASKNKENTPETMFWEDARKGTIEVIARLKRAEDINRKQEGKVKKELENIARQSFSTKERRSDFVTTALLATKEDAGLLTKDPTGAQTVRNIINRLEITHTSGGKPSDTITEFAIAGAHFFEEEYKLILEASTLMSP